MKYNYLKNVINTPPKIYGTRIYCRTVSHPFLKYLRKLFYKEKCKIVPKRFLRKLINPLSLAIWIMDDGTNELGSGKCLKINSQSFTYDEHKYLCNLLRRKFGLKADINKDRNYFRIRFHKESMEKLIGIVKPYILPSLFYKLSP